LLSQRIQVKMILSAMMNVLETFLVPDDEQIGKWQNTKLKIQWRPFMKIEKMDSKKYSDIVGRLFWWFA